jgi:hypothetical protein
VCCGVVWCGVLCCAVLCAVLCCAVLCCAVLVLCCAVLCASTLLASVLGSCAEIRPKYPPHSSWVSAISCLRRAVSAQISLSNLRLQSPLAISACNLRLQSPPAICAQALSRPQCAGRWGTVRGHKLQAEIASGDCRRKLQAEIAKGNLCAVKRCVLLCGVMCCGLLHDAVREIR